MKPKSKCAVCSKEFINLGVHMRVHNTPPNLKEVDEKIEEIAPKVEQYATKDDLRELTNLVKSLIPKEEKTMEKKVETQSNEPDTSPVPPKYRMLVDEHLGEEFGLNISYPDTGSGFFLRIIVPLDISNASSAHKEFYKCDIRTKAIDPREGLEGVKKFIEKVAGNLKIKKK